MQHCVRNKYIETATLLTTHALQSQGLIGPVRFRIGQRSRMHRELKTGADAVVYSVRKVVMIILLLRAAHAPTT